MTRPATWIAIVIACVAGFGCAQLLARSGKFRDTLAEFFDRGRLVAFVEGNGIYETDLRRQWIESNYVAGKEEGQWTDAQSETALTRLIADVAAQTRASHEEIQQSEHDAEFNALRFQFPDDKTWRNALARSTLSPASISRMLDNNLKTRRWIAKQIAPNLSVTTDECRQFFDSHRDEFFLPERRNVSHLFLAAPPETPPDVVEAKRAAIDALSARLAAGEDFATLAAQNSEDEATKLRGGELGYFSAKRMPPDFVEAAFKMQPGEIGKPVRTRLGFHILKLIDVQAPRQQTFDEVRGEIATMIANQKRGGAVQALSADLCRNPAYRRQF